MRSLLLGVAALLAACGQGGISGGSPSGWRTEEVRDELTGAVAQTATRTLPFDGGHVELSATCKGNQMLFYVDEWGQAAASEAALAVEIRMTFIGGIDGQSVSLASTGTQAGIEHSTILRASAQDGAEDRMVGFVDHTNSVYALVSAAGLHGLSALRIEVPVLIQSATSSEPIAQSVVVDVMPQDASLRALVAACDPSVATTASVAPSTAPATTSPALTLGAVPDGPFNGSAGCEGTDGSGTVIFRTDYSSAAIQLGGRTVDLAIGRNADEAGGGEFFDVTGRTIVRIEFTGAATETENESSVAPANLTLSVDGAESSTPISYECGS